MLRRGFKRRYRESRKMLSERRQTKNSSGRSSLRSFISREKWTDSRRCKEERDKLWCKKEKSSGRKSFYYARREIARCLS